MSYKPRTDLNIYKANQLESKFVEIINPKKSNIVIGCLYKHPNMDVLDFKNNHLSQTFENISKEQKQVFVLSDSNENFEMKDFGLLVCLEKPWLDVSPDGVTYCSCCEYKAVEIKCPYSLHESGLVEAIKSDTFYIKQHDKKYVLPRNHKYYSQVQHEIYILDVKRCDFVVWTPKDFPVIRIEKDQDFINAMIEKCDSFWKEVILPELMTRSIENSTKSIESVPQPLNIEKTYCFCKTIDVNREMVGCDECDQWFHPKSLKLKKLTTTKSWYSPSCK